MVIEDIDADGVVTAAQIGSQSLIQTGMGSGR